MSHDMIEGLRRLQRGDIAPVTPAEQEEMMAEVQRQYDLDEAEFGSAEDQYDGAP